MSEQPIRRGYVTRKQARKPCVHCGGTDVQAKITEVGTRFVCRASWETPPSEWDRGGHSPYDDAYTPKAKGTTT